LKRRYRLAQRGGYGKLAILVNPNPVFSVNGVNHRAGIALRAEAGYGFKAFYGFGVLLGIAQVLAAFKKAVAEAYYRGPTAVGAAIGSCVAGNGLRPDKGGAQNEKPNE
jgi:hypothetical protein